MHVNNEIASCRNCGDQLRTALELSNKGGPGRVFRRLVTRIKCHNCDQIVFGRSLDAAIQTWNHEQQENDQ